MSDLNIIKSGQGPALLLLHGFGFDHQIWAPILPDLNQKYRVYQIDLPGFGETPCMPWDVFQSILLQQLPAKIALVGWSMGGLIATQLALSHPERISHVINIASSPYFIAEGNWPGIGVEQLVLFYQQIKLNPEATLKHFIAMQIPKTHASPRYRGFNIKGLQNGLDILKNWDFRDKLHALRPPAAYLFGRLDHVVPANTITTMQSTYPAFHYELIQKAGHTPFLSHPDICLNFIHQFIETH